MRKYQINIPDTMNSQISAAHKQSKYSAMLPSQFIKYLITIGLKEYHAQCEIGQTNIEVCPQAAGSETAPDKIPEQHTSRKIIPFPGVVLKDNFQNSIDEFLKQMGYVE